MLWADSYWIFNDNRKPLTTLENDLVRELTEEHRVKDKTKLDVGSWEGAGWEMPFVGKFDLLSYQVRRRVKGIRGAERV